MPALRSCERLMDTNPLLRVLLPLMSGIGVAEWSYPLLSGWDLFLYVAAASAGLVCFLAVRGDSGSLFRSMVFQIALFFGLMALGAASLIDRRSALEVEWPEEARVFQAMAVETPRETDKTLQVTARLDGGAFSGQKIRLVLMKPKGGNVSSHKDGEDKNTATGTYVRRMPSEVPSMEKDKAGVSEGAVSGLDGKRLPRVGDRLLFSPVWKRPVMPVIPASSIMLPGCVIGVLPARPSVMIRSGPCVRTVQALCLSVSVRCVFGSGL